MILYSKRNTFNKFDQCPDFARDQNVAILFSLKFLAILDDVSLALRYLVRT